MLERGSFIETPQNGSLEWGSLFFSGSNGDPFQNARQRLAQLLTQQPSPSHARVRVSVAVSFIALPLAPPPEPQVQAPEPPIPEPSDATHKA